MSPNNKRFEFFFCISPSLFLVPNVSLELKYSYGRFVVESSIYSTASHLIVNDLKFLLYQSVSTFWWMAGMVIGLSIAMSLGLFLGGHCQ